MTWDINERKLVDNCDTGTSRALIGSDFQTKVKSNEGNHRTWMEQCGRKNGVHYIECNVKKKKVKSHHLNIKDSMGEVVLAVLLGKSRP